jgi:hypothetical protein
MAETLEIGKFKTLASLFKRLDVVYLGGWRNAARSTTHAAKRLTVDLNQSDPAPSAVVAVLFRVAALLIQAFVPAVRGAVELAALRAYSGGAVQANLALIVLVQ